MTTDRTEVVSADGFRVAVTVEGQGPPILIVHGGGGPSQAWDRVTKRLVARFRVYRFDRRPYLRPGAVDPSATMTNEVHDVVAVAASVGLPVLLVGHSSGAVVALEAALAAPECLAGLVLYEPPLAITEPLGGDALRRAQAAMAAGDPGRALEIHLRQIVQFSKPFVTLATHVGPLWRQMVAYTPGQMRDLENIESLGVGIDRYADLAVPALLLGGARSPQHLRARLDALATVLPAVDSVVILPHQGHVANALAPGTVARIIGAFADRVLR